MKNILILVGLILLLSFANSASAKDNILSKKLSPGMTIDQFKKTCPDLKPVDNSQFSHEETLHGLNGKWTFDFKQGRLSWILFDYYIQKYEDLNEKNFNKCLKATEKIIADLTKLYGKPYEVEEGTKKFRDPGKDRHWGYDVIEAKWKSGGNEITAKFKFFGSKGEYFFVVSVEFTSSSHK